MTVGALRVPVSLLMPFGGHQRAVGERLVRVMTGGAAHLAGAAEPLVVEELVAERDLLGRLRVVLGNRDGRQPEGLGVDHRDCKHAPAREHPCADYRFHAPVPVQSKFVSYLDLVHYYIESDRALAVYVSGEGPRHQEVPVAQRQIRAPHTALEPQRVGLD